MPEPDTATGHDAATGPLLLAHARDAIGEALGQRGAAVASPAVLSTAGAAFVTITLEGALRGCIGTLEAWRPLVDDVRGNAVAAATRDPRFHPVTLRELGRVRIEVSVLEAAVAMPCRDEAHAIAQLRPGQDGVVLAWRGRRATFLPQVWTSLPDPREFLRLLRRKAGLPEDFWDGDLALSRYGVRKWHEPASPVTGATR